MGNPDQPQPQDDSEMYDLAPEAAPPPMARPAPPTLNYRALKDEKPAPSDTEIIKNLRAPLWLLAGGVVVNVGFAMFTHRGAMRGAVLGVCSDIILETALMVGAMLLAARLRGIKLGSLPTTLLKLAAISVAPSAAVALLGPMLGLIPILGGLMLWVVEFALYFALLGFFFDLDESDTWYCIMVMILVGLAGQFLTTRLP